MTRWTRIFRSITCILLAFALVAPYIPQASASEDDFEPILRFVVTSDIHIRDTGVIINGYEQLEKLFNTAYDYSESQAYNKLDGIFFVGDLTQRGEEDQLNYFFNYVNTHAKEGTVVRTVLGNHEFYDTGSDYDGDAAPQRFLEISGYESTDSHLDLGGYHVIMMSMDRYSKSKNLYFSDAKLAWLKQEIEKAIADDPNKPIFVMQHEPPYQTMKGSYGTASDKGLKELLSNYPQVINFSGHTHCSLSDPRIIWQETFTALNTGGLAYLSVPIMDGTYNQTGGKANDIEGGWTTGDVEEGTRNAGMYYIVEVDKDNRVRILTYNMFTESLWSEPYLIDSFDPADFRYTNARENDAVDPEFEEDAAIRLCSDNYKNVKIAFPQAACKDVVQSYRVELYQGNTLLQTIYRSSMANYGNAAPAEINAYIQNLQQDAEYTVKVFATSSYNLDSDPLTLQFKTGKETGKVYADILDLSFQADGTAVNALTGETLVTLGAPTVEYDNNTGAYVGNFDGVDDAYFYAGLGNWYSVINDSFTIETYVYLAEKPAKYMNIVSNLQSAGMGIQYRSNGNVMTLCHVGSDYATVSTGVGAGSWVHLTTTFDGSTLKFYLNGQLAGETAAEGTMTIPEGTYFTRSLFIGADCKTTGAENFFKGKVATARVYSQVLSGEDVASLYNSANGAEGDGGCPEHENITGWTEISGADWAAGGEIAEGHYKLTGNVNISTALTVAENSEVCIDLAGYNITASGSAASGKWYRVFENYGNLTILDSVLNDGVISGGTVWVSDAEKVYSEGGNIYNGANATFTLYDGIISGGIASTAGGYKPGSIGGNIYGAAGSTINIKGGTVIGGVAKKGGSYINDRYVFGGNIGSDGIVNISGGTITGGQVTHNYSNTTASRYLYLYGGNIAVRAGAELNISGGMITDGKAIGTRTNSTAAAIAYGRGGNIYATDATVNITGGTISNGRIEITTNGASTSDSTTPAYSHAYGGNLYVLNGTLNMTGGAITGGTLDSTAIANENTTSTAKSKVGARGGNVYITGTAVANISGGTITGGRVEHNDETGTTDSYYGGNIFVYSTAVLNLSGGTVSNGFAYYRGGNIGAETGGTINISGSAIVKGGKLSNYSTACNGDNIAVLDEGTTLNIYGDAQILETDSNYSIYAITNASINMYGGYVADTIMLAGTNSNKKGTFAMYGGYAKNVVKSSYIPDTSMTITNGKLGTAPTLAWMTECTCYMANSDGSYTIWHTGSADGTCAGCGFDYSETKLETGSHNFTEDPLVCGTCGYVRGQLEITTVNLRAGAAGIYFSGNVSYNAADTSILSCGIAVSLSNSLPVADGSDSSSLYTTSGTSVLVSGIMKQENSTAANTANAKRVIYCRAYLQLADGSYLYSETVATCLKDVVEAIDGTLWNSLTDAQKASLAEMYNTFSDTMSSWDIDNIKTYQA